jgi:TonB family protein
MPQPRTLMKQRLGVAVFLCFLLFLLIGSANAQSDANRDSVERERGIQLYRQGKAKEALTQFQLALRENKGDSTSWYYLGLCLTREGQFKEASQAYEAVLKLQPELASARAGLAYTLLLRNKLKDALAEAERALAIDPALADARYVVGVIRLRSGDNAAALEAAEAVIRKDPNYAQAYLLKSQALASFSEDTELYSGDEPKEKRLTRYKEAAGSLATYLKLNSGGKSEETWFEQLEALKFAVSVLEKDGDARTIFPSREVTTKARVLKKQEPIYTASARQHQVNGTVVLRAVFAADGQVKHIFVVRGLPDGLTEQAIAAARAIKFIPATRDGKAVSMWMELQYNFSSY